MKRFDFPEETSETLSFTTSKAVKEKVEKMADERGISTSAVIRVLVQTALHDYEMERPKTLSDLIIASSDDTYGNFS